MTSPHAPVLLAEVIEALAPKAGDVVIDATFGAGGYTRAILERGADVVALDRDPTVQPFADAVAGDFPEQFQLIRTPFSGLAEAFEESGKAKLDGAVFDIGVSSMQLDQAERGFSFMRDGPLDMRMSDEGATAADIVNTWDHGPLAHIFKLYGDERQSGRVATAILRRRVEQPFTRTLDLAEVVEKALGGRRGAAIHPATRVFQALRIAVNDELGELERGLEAAEATLAPGGRLVVVTFHSLEDRIVKAFMTERTGNAPGGSRHAPVAVETRRPSFDLMFKGAREAGEAELAANPRARSAKIRAGVRTDAPAWGAMKGRAA
ncbi:MULTISPECIES: 16S rRNA (cytosine(1402)-N(4))-methyltransferase RsmH [Brevundimonas]|uniref:16S rRNA (cytosine(1402)-N(4))-methyltransferase RsmH n=1 Tax=Brevundimonas TaxID=41275 RepID=UPI0019043FAA|nr:MULTISPECIES: 16S rRNA (cytosine(1402)-N(4))-methyltransferase RsmH [Brevundimonas]MDA0743918.1 16S rRNA (cytosine(1402)-N(4))-methyltransferase RsmH [Pseudomonadota bacterium]MBK1968483.1 16S rRNA (cytosine(1402)-N(4))-methyltransferase RsmH [Brevundimonas diminuta]MBK1976255.1 16S rRNA (cytosine(1402)-N(4))-methyltransferase RsmH [Brevundimonas diminuta]MDA1320853.1 16S rRNA (cytosine(1402)-N(4))-methyltransferase RsmH [Pseudomonadota bacterium]MDM8353650.1 16S rRNA (cytosine(1402)-N(4))-